MCHTYKDFPKFYENDFIQSISQNEKWTISDKDKVPIDMFSLIYQHKITGALFNDSKSLVTLDKLCDEVPDAKNNAYYLDALTDNYVVLDIEKTCPISLKNKLLRLPYVYGELSLSGKGYHLVFPLPKECLEKYPIVKKKIVMKEEHGYYEILLMHYVTFTRNTLPVTDSTDQSAFIKLFEKMAAKQRETEKTDVDVSDIKPDNIPLEDTIINILRRQTYSKTLEDFYNDKSKYEYGYIGFFAYKLNCILNTSVIKKEHTYTDNEKAWLIYEVAKDIIPYRGKHEETRRGLPWLLYLSQEIISRNVKTKKGK